jgi:hypothetical protein
VICHGPMNELGKSRCMLAGCGTVTDVLSSPTPPLPSSPSAGAWIVVRPDHGTLCEHGPCRTVSAPCRRRASGRGYEVTMALAVNEGGELARTVPTLQPPSARQQTVARFAKNARLCHFAICLDLSPSRPRWRSKPRRKAFISARETQTRPRGLIMRHIQCSGFTGQEKKGRELKREQNDMI